MQQTFVTGILKLNTNFPRLPGDIGNPESVHGKVVLQTVTEANPASVITGQPLPAQLVDAFVAGAQNLVVQRVNLITTSCGFLLPLQSTLTSISDIPVITSSLLLLPLLTSIHGNHIGVLTYDREKLIKTSGKTGGNTDGLNDMPAAIEGLQPTDTLRQTIAQDHTSLDRQRAENEVLACASRLLEQWPDTRALVLECTNLSPYKKALQAHTGIPVYDLIDTIHWHQQASSIA